MYRQAEGGLTELAYPMIRSVESPAVVITKYHISHHILGSACLQAMPQVDPRLSDFPPIPGSIHYFAESPAVLLISYIFL